jgi:hypothetical protein
MSAIIDALTAATIEVTPPDARMVPARWALVLHQSDDPVAVRAEVEQELAPLRARVTALSELDPEVLVLELPDRIYAVDRGSAFAAAHELVATFDLDAAEPDLPTNLPAEGTAPPPGADEEGLGDLLFWCFVPEVSALDRDTRWALRVMGVPAAWEYSKQRQRPSEGQDVIVAQPDTGITDHPELTGVHRVAGWNTLHGNADTTDPMNYLGNPGHGTGTASVIVSPPDREMTGAAPRARHMALRAVESVIRLRQVTVARAVDWAVEHGASVITMSLGGLPSLSLHRALTRAVAADVIVLAAAGNCADEVVFPARYDDCIAVAGTDINDKRWPGSCRGPAVDVAAPGENVLRARAGARPGERQIGQSQGTSFAVALTAGVAALWLAHHGRANLVAASRARGETLSAMFRRLLRATARRPTNWNTFEMGSGVVDARALLAADLDRNRDRESVQRSADPRERAAIAVRSLVTEMVGYEAGQDATVDWYRDGPEIAAHLLLDRPAPNGRSAAPAGSIPESAGVRRAGRLSPTRRLDHVVGQADLRVALGLPPRPEADPSLEGAVP